MATELETPRGPGLHVLKRRVIGERFIGGIVSLDNRDHQKEGKTIYKRPDGSRTTEPTAEELASGKTRAVQELIVTLMCFDSTMIAGLGEDEGAPQKGDLVRLILAGGGYSQWIDAGRKFRDSLPAGAKRGISTGDMVMVNSTYADVYPGAGNDGGQRPVLRTTTSQEEVVAINTAYPKKETVGLRGELVIRAPRPEEAEFAQLCDDAHHNARLNTTELDSGPFDGPSSADQVEAAGGDNGFGF